MVEPVGCAWDRVEPGPVQAGLVLTGVAAEQQLADGWHGGAAGAAARRVGGGWVRRAWHPLSVSRLVGGLPLAHQAVKPRAPVRLRGGAGLLHRRPGAPRR